MINEIAIGGVAAGSIAKDRKGEEHVSEDSQTEAVTREWINVENGDTDIIIRF